MSIFQPRGKWYKSPVRKLYFADTDAAGVMHHSQYIRYYEAGRIDCLDDIGCSYSSFQKESIGFVPIHLDVRYMSPLVFGDTFWIESRFIKLLRASFIIEARIVSDKGIHSEVTLKLACMNESNWALIALPKRLSQHIELFEAQG
jgi:acyl-CoA thioester hydrolase